MGVLIGLIHRYLRIPPWMQRRLVFFVFVLVCVMTINFILPRLMPEDFTALYIDPRWDPETVAAVRRRLGLDLPVWQQYLIYMRNSFTGDLGVSYSFPQQSVGRLMWERLPRTMLLLLPAQLLSVAIGYFTGVAAGWKAGSKTDSINTAFGLSIWAMPLFWVSMVVLYFGAIILGWFPLAGWMTVGSNYGFWRSIPDYLWYVILPWIAVMSQYGASQLVMRNTMTITLRQNYVITARAKGLSENRVKHRHAARNALLPLVTSTTLSMAMAISGMVFVETIFSYPGMGKMIFDAIRAQDYPLIQGAFFVFTLVLIGLIFTLDIIYARLDPRIRYD